MYFACHILISDLSFAFFGRLVRDAQKYTAFLKYSNKAIQTNTVE